MESKDLNAQAERYKRELMKLYSKRQDDHTDDVPEEETTAAPVEEEISQEQDAPEDEEIFGVDEDAADDTAYSSHSDESSDFEKRYPDPDISELGDVSEGTAPPIYANEDSLGGAAGYILVNVRTADEASPVEGAEVLVTAVVDGARMIIASGITDPSGTTRKMEVPVPDVEHSLRPGSPERPYNLFDVSVSAEGFFNARSVDVPVFAGITSVQNFSMIPVPAMMSPASETMTYYNQEPTPLSDSE